MHLKTTSMIIAKSIIIAFSNHDGEIYLASWANTATLTEADFDFVHSPCQSV